MLALFRSLRPRQWIKNVVVFAGVGFSKRATVAEDFLDAFLVFAAFCLVSSASYLANDVFDAERDRRHPVKRHRPVAAGEVSAERAMAAAFVLGAAGLGIAASLGTPSLAVIGGYVLLQGAYNLGLKHVVILDVFCIAAGFLLRVLAGVFAIDVVLSPWLVACSTELALFLALCKRKAEAMALQGDAAEQRPALPHYLGQGTDVMISVVASAVLVTYSLYTLLPGSLLAGNGDPMDSRAGTPGMVWTLPFVLYGVLRYLYLVYRRDLGERPERIVTADGPMLLSIAGYLAVAGVVIYQ